MNKPKSTYYGFWFFNNDIFYPTLGGNSNTGIYDGMNVFRIWLEHNRINLGFGAYAIFWYEESGVGMLRLCGYCRDDVKYGYNTFRARENYSFYGWNSGAYMDFGIMIRLIFHLVYVYLEGKLAIYQL